MLAMRIFGILPNSMPDECTGSHKTWFNTPLRNRLGALTLRDMIQVGQFARTQVSSVLFFGSQLMQFHTVCGAG
jgi:hypothetical protein